MILAIIFSFKIDYHIVYQCPCITQSLVLCVCFVDRCWSIYDSDYSFCIYKLFVLINIYSNESGIKHQYHNYNPLNDSWGHWYFLIKLIFCHSLFRVVAPATLHNSTVAGTTTLDREWYFAWDNFDGCHKD